MVILHSLDSKQCWYEDNYGYMDELSYILTFELDAAMQLMTKLCSDFICLCLVFYESCTDRR